MRCSARRRRAAATISIARVIFWMFLTEEIRFLTSLSAMASVVPLVRHGVPGRPPAPPGKDAVPQETLWDFKGRGRRQAVISGRSRGVRACGWGHRLGLRPDGLGLGLALLLLRLLAPAALLVADRVLLGERVALLVEVVAEVVGELLDRVAQRLLGPVGPVAGAHLVQRVGGVGVQALDQLLVELGHAVDADAV